VNLSTHQVQAIRDAGSAQPEEVRALAEEVLTLREIRHHLLEECAEKRRELDELHGVIR